MISTKGTVALSAVTLVYLLGPAGCAAGHRRDRDRELAFHSRCGPIIERIERDHEKIDRYEEGGGRRRDDLRWYRDDLEDAERDLDRCRASVS